MSLKPISCTECRKQHRKCVRLDKSDICKRCDHMDLICVLPTVGATEDPNEPVDGTKQLRQMQATVDLLQHTIQQVELEMNQYKGIHQYSLASTIYGTPLSQSPQLLIGNKYTDLSDWLEDTFSESSSSADTITNRRSLNNKETDDDSTQSVTDQKDDNYSLSTCNDGDRYLKQQGQGLLLTSGKEWKMTLVNGQWRIETDIKTLGGLDLLNQNINRSPSPFPGFCVDTIITIEPFSLRTILPLTVRLARNHLLAPPTNSTLLDNNPFFQTPPILALKPLWVIGQLVDIYFKCYNTSMAILHKETYMAHYQQLKNPLTCPVTMALCTYVCCGHHPIAASTNIHEHENQVEDDNGPEWVASMTERRAMGEFFYRHCRDILDDIFDNPERRLETVMTINLLKRFMMNTLRVSEMRKLETMAYLICVDLKPTYKSRTNVSKVERALFARHYAFCIWCHVAVDFFMDSISHHDDVDFIFLEMLPGESDYTRKFVDIQNHFFKVFLLPSVHLVFENVQKILLGAKIEMTLEHILQFEQVTKKWWHDLPDEYRLCDDPYEFDNVMKAIKQTQDDSKLTLLLFFVDIILSFHFCLLKIQRKVSDGDDAMVIDSDVLYHIRDKSVKACLEFSEMLIVTVNQLDTDVGYSQFLSDCFLFVAVDILASLTLFEDKRTVTLAKQKMALCFSALESADFMVGHRVPLASSPLTSTLIDSNATLFHLYDQYPQPRYALLYDICRHLSPLDTSL